MKYKVIFAFFLLPLCCVYAQGCDFAEPPTFQQQYESASSIFVFQILSAVFDESTGKVDARIKVVKTIKGPSLRFTHIKYYSDWCFGNRFDVGNYFLSVTSQTGRTLALDPADRSVIDVTLVFDPASPSNNALVQRVNEHLISGKTPTERDLGVDPSYTQKIPMPFYIPGQTDQDNVPDDTVKDGPTDNDK